VDGDLPKSLFKHTGSTLMDARVFGLRSKARSMGREKRHGKSNRESFDSSVVADSLRMTILLGIRMTAVDLLLDRSLNGRREVGRRFWGAF